MSVGSPQVTSLMAPNVPLAVLLLEVGDDPALAGGFELGIVAVDSSPGEVVGVDSFVLGNVADGVTHGGDGAEGAVGLVLCQF